MNLILLAGFNTIFQSYAIGSLSCLVNCFRCTLKLRLQL